MAQLWPILFGRLQLEIAFAHRTFAWSSEARGKAHVHVVIVGLVPAGSEPASKRLFSYDDIKGDPAESTHKALTAYLFDAGGLGDRHLVVKEVAKPINGLPELRIGSKPIDGGYLVLDDAAERAAFLAQAPDAASYVRPYVGAEEYINGGDRSIICAQTIDPAELARLPNVAERLRKVRAFRSGKLPEKRSKTGAIKTRGISSAALADTPAAFHVTVIPEKPFLAVPEVSSERREYVPLGWLEPPTVPSNLLKVCEEVTLSNFGIVTSAMHMAWLRNIGGRLKSDYRYSIGLVYNTFPWPRMSALQEQAIEGLARGVLDARAAFPGATLAELYDPDLMPSGLRKAHRALDLAVDRLYRRHAFASERERVEHLFGLYEVLAAPMMTARDRRRNQ